MPVRTLGCVALEDLKQNQQVLVRREGPNIYLCLRTSCLNKERTREGIRATRLPYSPPKMRKKKGRPVQLHVGLIIGERRYIRAMDAHRLGFRYVQVIPD